MTTVNTEERLEKIQKDIQSLYLGLSHACLLIDLNMETVMEIMDALHPELTESQSKDLDTIFESALSKVETLQTHFEELQQKVANGTLELEE